MGKLSKFTDQIQGVQSKLNEADDIKNDTSSFLNERFDQSDKKLDANLKSVLKEQSEQAVFAATVHQTVLQVTQNNQMMLHNMINDLKILERKLGENTKEISNEVGGVDGKVGKTMQTQLKAISSEIAKIPTKIPEQKETDLSGLDRAVMAVGLAVQNIPTAKFPDMSGNFKTMEKKIAELQKKLSTRVHTFEIERDQDKLVKNITVRTK